MSEKSREYLLGVSTTLAVVFFVIMLLVLGAFGEVIKQRDELRKQIGCSEQCIK